LTEKCICCFKNSFALVYLVQVKLTLIELKKFGTTLTSRDDGREALAIFKSILKSMAPDEVMEVNFDNVDALSPAWADEFIIGLSKLFPGRLKLKPSDNLSVKATLDLLRKIHQIKF